MSEVKRYMESCGEGGGVVEHRNGDLVSIKDFDRVTAERDAALGLSVTKIMLDIVPGYDGMGEEVYAKSVEDIEHAFTKLYDEVERLTDQRDALQQRLTAADERVHVLELIIRSALDSSAEDAQTGAIELERSDYEAMTAALKPAKGGGDGRI